MSEMSVHDQNVKVDPSLQILAQFAPLTCRTPGVRSIHGATRTHGAQGHLTEFICDRRPAYC